MITMKVFQTENILIFLVYGGGEKVTVNEASEKYHIPVEILKEYESWGLCDEVRRVMGVWQYDDRDIQRLSMIMTLHDIGFDNSEVEAYMRLLLEGNSSEEERLDMLNKKRGVTLDELHFKQKQLERVDYLRDKIQKAHG